MSKLTAEEIIEILEEREGIDVYEFAYGDFDSPADVGEWEEVKHYGGEGQGDTWYSVKYFKDHDVYIRTDGFYSSYNGTDFDEGFGREVKPAEKTITVYN